MRLRPFRHGVALAAVVLAAAVGAALDRWLGDAVALAWPIGIAACLGIAGLAVASRAALRQRERYLEVVIDSSPALISYIGADLRYRFANRQYEQWFGKRRADIVGHTMEEVLGPAALDVLRPYLARVLAGETVRFEREAPYRSGGTRFIEAQYVPDRARDGEVLGFFVFVLDVTDRKLAERRKDEFLATLAHELRNPLAPIGNAVELMRLRTPADPELRWSQQVIERQVAQMARLLDDLLDVNRVARGVLELQPRTVALAAVVDAALETSRALIEEAGHAFTVELPAAPVCVHGDPLRLAQVFANLLNNAAKYTPRAGQVALRARADGRFVTVEVSDTGIGIEPAMLPQVFQMFAQAEPARARSRGGLGVGLALVRTLVELHGGSVEVRSEGAGRGSTFTVRLPQAGAPATARAPAREPAAAAVPRGRVLIADDLPDTADSLGRLLREVGYEVAIARDGAEAVAVAASFDPDVAVLDLGMPRLNGYDAGAQIRQQGQRVRLVALSGWGQQEDRRRTRAAGFDVHLVKPVDPARLLETVAALAQHDSSDSPRKSGAPGRI